MRPRKLIVTTLLVALIATACSSSGSDSGSAAGGEAETASSASSSQASGASLPDGPSALDDRFDSAFPDPLINPDEIRSGGPPPDGIPPIDDPQFVSVPVADEWLSDTEPVLLLDIDGDVRVYPVQILMWHEIVNDVVGGEPVSITYCPLCNSAITFKRTIRGVETTFGTSGSLYVANLVMYDRATESLWNQLDGRAVVGVLTGEVLEQISSPMVAWGDVRESQPDALVLDRNRTGVSRSYGTNPYTGLDNPDGRPFLFSGDVDVRAKAMQRIVAVETDAAAAAWALEAIAGTGAGPAVTTGAVGDDPVVLFWTPGQSSALDKNNISDGRDVGSVGVFSPVLDGETLEFSTDGDDIVDTGTGSTWNVLGEAVAGELVGSQLTPVVFVRTFWFSWSTFRPDTTLVDNLG
ncbi:MAG: DUF3179 domain-containing protein [Acidimicrobiales bacterium]